MPSFFNRRLSPDFIAVPHEQSAAERAATGRFSAREVVSLIDGHLCDQLLREGETVCVTRMPGHEDGRRLCSRPGGHDGLHSCGGVEWGRS